MKKALFRGILRKIFKETVEEFCKIFIDILWKLIKFWKLFLGYVTKILDKLENITEIKNEKKIW